VQDPATLASVEEDEQLKTASGAGKMRLNMKKGLTSLTSNVANIATTVGSGLTNGLDLISRGENVILSNPFAIEIEVERIDKLKRSTEVGADSTMTLVLVADSKEQWEGWLVVLHWLASGCKKKVTEIRNDSRMVDHNVAPKRLTSFEWSLLKSDMSLLDMPFGSVRDFLLDMQDKHALAVTRAYDRDYCLYITFQLELYCYNTISSDHAQLMSGAESAIQECDGINLKKALNHLCLVNCTH
jgi:hypothetical protein